MTMLELPRAPSNDRIDRVDGKVVGLL